MQEGGNTIFGRIIRKESPAEIIHEDEHCIAFHDIAPQAPVHVLVVPRKPIPSLDQSTIEDLTLLGHLMLTAKEIADMLELSNGYRLVINTGEDGMQTIPHLHIHLMGGRRMEWPPG